MSFWFDSTTAAMSCWNMSRSTTYEMKLLSLTGSPSIVTVTLGAAAPTDHFPFLSTLLASFSLTVQVARSGWPSEENIEYFVESDSMTHWNFGKPRSPQLITQWCGLRSFSSFDFGSRTEASF